MKKDELKIAIHLLKKDLNNIPKYFLVFIKFFLIFTIEFLVILLIPNSTMMVLGLLVFLVVAISLEEYMVSFKYRIQREKFYNISKNLDNKNK